MVKKKFTDQNLIDLDNKSDVELIEEMNSGAIGGTGLTVINALLDRRLKRSLHDLTHATKQSSQEQAKYSRILLWLTVVLVILTVLLVFLTAIMISN